MLHCETDKAGGWLHKKLWKPYSLPKTA